MKLDGNRSQECADPAIIFNEVDPFCGNGGATQVPCPIHELSFDEPNKAKFAKVVQVTCAVFWIAKAEDITRFVRVVISQVLQHFSLKRADHFHSSGLRDRRFEWSQNDSTACSCTHLRPG